MWIIVPRILLVDPISRIAVPGAVLGFSCMPSASKATCQGNNSIQSVSSCEVARNRSCKVQDVKSNGSQKYDLGCHKDDNLNDKIQTITSLARAHGWT